MLAYPLKRCQHNNGDNENRDDDAPDDGKATELVQDLTLPLLEVRRRPRGRGCKVGLAGWRCRLRRLFRSVRDAQWVPLLDG